MHKNFKTIALLATAMACLALAACSLEDETKYSWHVKPILEKHCLSCHQPGGQGFEASGFNMASYEDLMKGTKFGPMILPGDPEGSNLVVLMEGRADPSISMPHGDLEPASKAEIETIRTWIAEGAQNN